MKVSDFDFNLPEELIAQHPLEDRSSSKLLHVNRKTGELEHRTFHEIIEFFQPGDVLVLNESRVIPARLFGEKKDTGAVMECLLLKETDEHDIWETLVKPGKRVKEGTVLTFGNGLLEAKYIGRKEDGVFLFQFIYEGIFLEILEELGTMPLPPYIHEQLEDQERYQTVYANAPGSVAAPTAGLHFTPELLKAIEAKGVQICPVTLHVGLGTFRPVSVDEINEHIMHSEYYEIDQKSSDILNDAKANNQRVISVGTTSTRVLETMWNTYGEFRPANGWTDIFISPGYEWKVVNGLITNFHLPKSTLMMLVSSFATREIMMHAYEQAVQEKYRFFSFGDSMIII